MHTSPVQFVVLHHTGIAEPHFDVMVERAPGADLVTWRSPAWPIVEPTLLTRLPDHRRHYLTYEGAISNNRGQVRRVFACDVNVAVHTDNSGMYVWTLSSVEPVNDAQGVFLVIHENADGNALADIEIETDTADD